MVPDPIPFLLYILSQTILFRPFKRNIISSVLTDKYIILNLCEFGAYPDKVAAIGLYSLPFDSHDFSAHFTFRIWNIWSDFCGFFSFSVSVACRDYPGLYICAVQGQYGLFCVVLKELRYWCMISRISSDFTNNKW